MGSTILLAFAVLTVIVLVVYLRSVKKNPHGKNEASWPQQNQDGEPALDDVTFIQEMKHIQGDRWWHQYDVLLAASGYGWETMISWAEYMNGADLTDLSEIQVGEMGTDKISLLDQYRTCGGRVDAIPELTMERGSLSIAGISRTLKAPMKIVWFNQTRILRFFTYIDDEPLMNRYIETVIRRTFGTADAMKPAKPLPDHPKQ